jgi:hypothetical protein
MQLKENIDTRLAQIRVKIFSSLHLNATDNDRTVETFVCLFPSTLTLIRLLSTMKLWVLHTSYKLSIHYHRVLMPGRRSPITVLVLKHGVNGCLICMMCATPIISSWKVV